jgi:hypothetical protein
MKGDGHGWSPEEDERILDKRRKEQTDTKNRGAFRERTVNEWAGEMGVGSKELQKTALEGGFIQHSHPQVMNEIRARWLCIKAVGS